MVLYVIRGPSAGRNGHIASTPKVDADGQIAFGPGGRLHALIVNNSSGVIGFYHTFADLGGELSGSVDLTWSTPNLVLERQQSTGLSLIHI